MGYNSSVSGEITITPPLTAAEIKDSPYLDAYKHGLDVALQIVEETVDTDNGTLTRRSATAIIPACEDSYKAYYIVEHVQKLVDAFGTGHNFTGYLSGEGEDNTDMWRVYVNKQHRAVQVDAQINWPAMNDMDGAQLTLPTNPDALTALLERASTLTTKEMDNAVRLLPPSFPRTPLIDARIDRVNEAWNAARAAVEAAGRMAEWDAVGEAGERAPKCVAGPAARQIVGDAAVAIVIRDLISDEQFDLFTAAWRAAFGPIPGLGHAR